MKLFTILSVAIALVSALTFVNLYKKGHATPSEAVTTTASAWTPAAVTAPSPDTKTSTYDGTVSASVRIGNPGEVSASVKVGG